MGEEGSAGNTEWEGNSVNIMGFKSGAILLHFKKALGTVHFSCGLIFVCQRVILNFKHHIVPAEHQKHFMESQQAIESGLKPAALSLRHSFLRQPWPRLF